LAATLKIIAFDSNSFSLNETSGVSKEGLFIEEGVEAYLVVIVKTVIKLLFCYIIALKKNAETKKKYSCFGY